MKPPRTGVNRRDLLRLRRNECRDVDTGHGTRSTVAGSGTDLIRVHRPAMGSYFEIRLGARVPGALDLANRALDLIDELEAQLTVYSDESEISRLNATAHLGPVGVEPGLFGLLERAVALSKHHGRGL